MRSLVQKMPHLATLVLNRSMNLEPNEKLDGETVRCDFEFIEDLYRIDGWKNEVDESPSDDGTSTEGEGKYSE